MYHVPHRHHWSYGMSRHKLYQPTIQHTSNIHHAPHKSHGMPTLQHTAHKLPPYVYGYETHPHSLPNTHHNPCTAFTHLPPYTVHAHCHLSPPSPIAHSICRAPGHTFHPALLLPLPREEAQRHLHDHPHGRKPRRHGEMVGAE